MRQLFAKQDPISDGWEGKAAKAQLVPKEAVQFVHEENGTVVVGEVFGKIHFFFALEQSMGCVDEIGDVRVTKHHVRFCFRMFFFKPLSTDNPPPLRANLLRPGFGQLCGGC